SLQEALKNVPGVTLNAGEGGSHGDSINLRGFPASDDFFLDGLRDTGFYTRDDFDLDAIEVYKGPASTLFGRGSTGGVIDQVSKQPKLGGFEDGSFTVGTNAEVRGVFDIDAPITDDAAIRIAGMAMRANVTDRDDVLNQRWGLAPSLKLGFGGPTTFTLSVFHQQEDNIPDYGIPFVAGRPAPVDRSNFYGLANYDRNQTNVNVVTAKLSHRFSDDLTVTETARYGNYWFLTLETAPHYDPAKVNPIPVPTAATPLSQIQIFRDRPSVSGIVETAMSQTQATYRSNFGWASNALVAGLDLDQETSTLARYVNQISQIPTTSLLDPNPDELIPGGVTNQIRQRPRTATDTVGAFLVDTLDIGAHWSLIGGIRYDRFHANFNEPITGAHFDHTDNIPSPRAAIVYKPTPNQSFYFSYGTSFDPSAENLSLAANNQALPPERDKTYEAGAKFQFLNGGLSLAGSIFRTEMTNARVADPDNAALQALAGDLLVKGFELDVSGYITPQIEILANYTFLDGKNTTPKSAGLTVNPLQNMAPNQVNAWVEYEPDESWKLGTGINYLGRREADVNDTAFVPSYVTWDAMLSYRVNRRLTLQVNALNLTDALYFTNSYFTAPTENHVVPGPGRTVLFTALGRF
ncbi:MAG TPA: TonB-dependent siderophore receptor, partial [Caulobacteraceae bacterium]|nr:TonB-dependent siderophore receptor [Caulobacteraceae bacterium]